MPNRSKFYNLVSQLKAPTIYYFSCISGRIGKSMDDLKEKLETAYTASGGRKVNLITHSMGGLLVMCFISLHNEVLLFHTYQRKHIQNTFQTIIFKRDDILYLYRYFPSMLISGSLLHVLFKVTTAHYRF